MNKVQLNKYSNGWYQPGSRLKRILWYFTNIFVFKTSLPFPSSVKVFILKAFGAKVGEGVVIKPCVNIKYPWFLEIGSLVWIGEEAWIDNLATVTIGDNVVLSQGAYLLTGSHDYKKVTFDLFTSPIMLEEGVWIGAKSVVCPGVICKSHSVLSVGSVATSNLESYTIYQGVPAVEKRTRVIG